jgi:hypothetical protein
VRTYGSMEREILTGAPKDIKYTVRKGAIFPSPGGDDVHRFRFSWRLCKVISML